MNVKKGDLAILIKSATNENVGKICEVMRYIGRHSWPDVTLENIWQVRFQSPIKVLLTGSDGKLHEFHESIAMCADEWLRPITGLDDSDSTNDESPIDIKMKETA